MSEPATRPEKGGGTRPTTLIQWAGLLAANGEISGTQGEEPRESGVLRFGLRHPDEPLTQP
jgi:hypothetical protein